MLNINSSQILESIMIKYINITKVLIIIIKVLINNYIDIDNLF